MSTILESVNTLSEKLGVTEREQTIKDQLDLCVERLGGEGNSKDIAESAEKFAEKEDGTATFMAKTITENNTYNAADDGVSGYSSVTVNVANSYTSDDNGKVVSEQELVAQTAYPTTVTQNDTYDTTNYNSITVVVPSGGGETFVVGLVDEETLEVSKTLTESLAAYNSNKRVELGMELGPDETVYAVAMLWDSNNLAFILRSGPNNISVLPYVDETHVELMPYSENT